MTDTNVIKLAQPGTFTDSLTEILRNGARALLTQAVRRKSLTSWSGMPSSRPRRATNGSCGTLSVISIVTRSRPLAVHMPQSRN